MQDATSVPQGPTYGDEVELIAPARLQTCIGIASLCIASLCRSHWVRTSLPSVFPFVILFLNTPFFHLPDCIIAAGVRDFIMAGYDTSWH
jgi:hypothetical protein